MNNENKKVLLKVEHLEQYFKLGKKTLKAVDDVNFEIYEGEVFGLVGESGCGKTTTGEHHAKSIIKLQDKDKIKSYLKWADIKPSKLLEGEKPIEWEEKLSIKDEIEESIFLGLANSSSIMGYS